jgi:predicted ATPase
MIRSLEIKGYRSIKDLRLEMGPVRILIGPNASGKSNIMDALRLLAEAVSADMETAVTRRGDLASVVFLCAAQQQFSINLEYFVTDPHSPNSHSDMCYRVDVAAKDGRPGVALEELRVKANRGDPGRRRIWFQAKWGAGNALRDPEKGVQEPFETGDPGILALKALGFLEAYPRIRALRTFIEQWQFLAVSLGAIREPQRDRREISLAPDASNLANVLRTLSSTSDPRIESIAQDMHMLLSRVEDIRTEVDRGRVLLLLREQGMPRPLEALSLSDGTIRLLAIVTALHTIPEHGLLCIEEPEHGLHPLIFGPLLDLVREACPEGGARQVLLTTHSPDLVDAAEPNEVATVDRDSGGATVLRNLDGRSLGHWLQEFRLGELWKMRQIGAVP